MYVPTFNFWTMWQAFTKLNVIAMQFKIIVTMYHLIYYDQQNSMAVVPRTWEAEAAFGDTY